MANEDPLVTTLEKWMDVFMHRSMQNLLQFAREKGFSMSQLGALFHLNNMGASGVSDLGEHLGVTSAAASQMLDRLVGQGLIERKEDPNDRRVKQIVLSEKGEQVLEESFHSRHAWLADVSEAIPESKRAQVMAALSILVECAGTSEHTTERLMSL